jgi:hypothetical protein
LKSGVNETPEIHVLADIRITYEGGKIRSVTHVCPGPGCPGRKAVVAVRGSDVSNFEWSANPVDAVTKFVQQQIDLNQIDIGPPIQVIALYRNGRIDATRLSEGCKLPATLQ